MPFRLSLAHSSIVTLLGILAVAGSLIWYHFDVIGSSIIDTANLSTYEIAAYAALLLVLVGLILAFFGLTKMIQKTSDLQRFSSVLSDPSSARVFTLSAVGYGLVFSVVSSTITFQPELSFSNTYGVHVPSLVPVVCCGSFGQMPQLVLYLTQQIALLIVPENLVLLFVVSWLVGLNAAIAYYGYSSRFRLMQPRWMGGFGAAIGLFTVCPSCAGFFLLESLGLTGEFALTIGLASVQALFIATGIPILALTPALMMRRIVSADSCQVVRCKDNISSR